MLFLVPIVAGAATYGAATQNEAGSYSGGDGSRTIDAYQIWEQVTTGPGAGSINEGQISANTLQRVYQDRVTQIDELNRVMDQAWQGEGADAARSGAHPLKEWMQDSGDKLQESDRALGEQSAAFETVYSRVQPIPKEPPESGFLNDITPWETDTDRAINDYNTKAQANVDAFNEYFKASSANGERLPTYSALDGEVGDVNVDENGGGDDERKPGDGTDKPGGSGDGDGTGGGGSGGGGDYSGGGIPGGIGGPGGGGSYGGGGSGGGGSYGSGGGGTGIPGIGGPGGYGSGSGGPGAGSGGYGSGGYNVPEWDDTTSSSGYSSPKVPSADFSTSGYTPSGFGPGGGGGSGSGSYSGGGVGGVGGIGGFGPGAAAGGAGAPGSGSTTGSAPGAGSGAGRMGGAAMGAAAAAGAAGRGGMGGMPMGAMGGAGRGGQGSDDEEHQSKFLVEEDGNSLFGTDELTAPPVIGE
ncbi:hypothetical protein BAY59_04440 [Prauserella coralliicola]|nr:hypothetical protein BAY59_04440 [Prauserella coralliicola]